jgi:NADP-reducing hydrogenase subunit HndC
MPIRIDYEKCCWKDGKCTSCECGGTCVSCVDVCPVSALERKMIVEFDSKTCIDCGACVDACKYNAISLI